MKRRKSKIVIGLFLAATLLFTGVFTVSAGGQVGGRPTTHTAESASSQSLTKVVNEFGRISLSLDALGTLDATGTIQVEKPAGATVRKAYLMTATTGWSSYRLSTGDVKILGNDVVWEKELSNSIVSYNYWANVTAIIKATLDAAPSGIVNLDISELSTGNIDGEILAVIFDDPNQTTNNTVLLYFGAQNVSGDSFVIDFGTPVVKDDPKLVLDYSLGISYGCQGGAGCAVPPQYSIIDVNGSRLTSAAGGEDDGFTQNGALITVGGIDDNNDNPPDPNAVPVNQYSDDELYNLKSFVNDGDTSVTIDTVNPSNDDNIFFAAVFLGSTRNVVSVDVDISLYNNPSTTEARAPYENIIKYMADGIYEASNGAHKLGKVTFYPDGENSNQAEVVWVEKCHPNANVAGFGTNGLHVNMCDIFKDGNGLGSDYNFLSSDGNQKGGGYTLAHEWGHFYYSLYDEYVGGSDTNSIFHFPHSTDKAVLNAIMNSQWNAIGGDFNWLNFSTAKNDTKETAQYRVYQASGWETLVRPVSDDPRDGDRVSLPGRLYHAELKDVAPGANESPAIDLPGTAQSALSIVWESTSSLTSPSTDTLSLPFNVQLNSILGQNLSYPNPILLLAFVHQDLMITDMGVAGSIKLPDGTTKPVVFTDDGVPPDAEKGDGLYSAILGYEEGGVYTVEVQFDNNENQAKFVSDSFSPSSGADGQPVPMSEPISVNQNFSVSKTLQILVSNVVADDYGNTPAAAYTIVPDNTSYPGKIDSAGDKDVFKLETTNTGITAVRVTGLALGMKPHLRVVAADQTTVLFNANLDPTKEYLLIPLLGLQPGTTVYAELSDQSSTASGGLYEFSSGEKLGSDPLHLLFLPMITLK